MSSSRVVHTGDVKLSVAGVSNAKHATATVTAVAVTERPRRRCCCCALKVIGVVALVLVVAVLASMVHTYKQVDNQLRNGHHVLDHAQSKVDLSQPGPDIGMNTELAHDAPASAHSVTVTETTCDLAVNGHDLAIMTLTSPFELVRTAGSSPSPAGTGRSLDVSVQLVNGVAALELVAKSMLTKFTDAPVTTSAVLSCKVSGKVGAMGGLFDIPFSMPVDQPFEFNLDFLATAISSIAASMMDMTSPFVLTSDPLDKVTVKFPEVAYDLGYPTATHYVSTASGDLICTPNGCRFDLEEDEDTTTALVSFGEIEDATPTLLSIALGPISKTDLGGYGLVAVATTDNALTHCLGDRHTVEAMDGDSFATHSRLHDAERVQRAYDNDDSDDHDQHHHGHNNGLGHDDHDHGGDHDNHHGHGRMLGNPDARPYDVCEDLVLCYVVRTSNNYNQLEVCVDIAVDLSHLWFNATNTVGMYTTFDAVIGWYETWSDGTSGTGDAIVDVAFDVSSIVRLDGTVDYDHDGTALELNLGDNETLDINAYYDVDTSARTYLVGAELDILEDNGWRTIAAEAEGTVVLTHVADWNIVVPGIHGKFTMMTNGTAILVEPLHVLSFVPADDALALPILLHVNISGYAETDDHDDDDDDTFYRRRRLVLDGIGDNLGEVIDYVRGQRATNSTPVNVTLYAAASRAGFVHVMAHGQGALAGTFRAVPNPVGADASDMLYDAVVVFAEDRRIAVDGALVQPNADGLIDYEALSNFTASHSNLCPRCRFGADGEDEDEDDFSGIVVDRRDLAEVEAVSEGYEDSDSGGFFSRGEILNYLVGSLGATTAPLAHAVLRQTLPTTALARSYVHVRYWAANATARMDAPTNDRNNMDFRGHCDAAGIATLALNMSTKAAQPGHSEAVVDVLGVMGVDGWRNFTTGARAHAHIKFNASLAAFAENAAWVETDAAAMLVRNVTNESAFRAKDYAPPTDMTFEEAEPGDVVSVALGAPAQLLGALAVATQSVPVGSLTSNSRVVFASTTGDHTGTGAAGMGFKANSGMHYWSHPVNNGDFELHTTHDINATGLFRRANESHRVSATCDVSTAPSSHPLCPTQLTARVDFELYDAGEVSNATVNASACTSVGADLQLAGLSAAIGSRPAAGSWSPLLIATMDSTASSTDLSTAVSAGTEFTVATTAWASFLGDNVGDLEVNSTFALGTDQNKGGLWSVHNSSFEGGLLDMAADQVSAPPLLLSLNLDAFVDNELLTLHGVLDGQALNLGAIAKVELSLECGSQCPCTAAQNCSTAMLLSRPAPGTLRQYGKHGFNSMVRANITVQNMGELALVNLPVNWTVPAPTGDGALHSVLVVGGGDSPILQSNSNPIVDGAWTTTIGPANESAGALPSGVTLSDATLFNFTTELNLTTVPAGTEGLYAVFEMDKTHDPMYGGAGNNTFLTRLWLADAAGNSLLGENALRGQHMFWPAGAGFKSQHKVMLGGSLVVEVSELDIFTGADVVRGTVNFGAGLIADVEVGGTAHIHLAGPVGYLFAHVVDMQHQMMDSVMNTNFFYRDYVSVMRPYRFWNTSHVELFLGSDANNSVVHFVNDWSANVADVKSQGAGRANEFGTMLSIAPLTLDVGVHGRQSWYSTQASYGWGWTNVDVDAVFNTTFINIVAAAGSFVNYEHNNVDDGVKAVMEPTMHYGGQFDAAIVLASSGLTTVIHGNASGVATDTREEASMDLVLDARAITSSQGVFVNAVEVDLDAVQRLSHYSGNGNLAANLTIDQITAVYTTSVVDAQVDVNVCDFAAIHACAGVGGDADYDAVCDDLDSCPDDQENDADSDEICAPADECPYDAENDPDGDDICGDVDSCPYTANNDADGDGLCYTVDSCPRDAENDADSDMVCGDDETCPYDPENDVDDDDRCGNEDSCPYDKENDADSDSTCGDIDSCEFDADNDADSDTVCGDEDACPNDPENDPDKDSLCRSVDSCPYSHFGDTDSDMVCDASDPCPFEPDVTVCDIVGCAAVGGDADSDTICGDVDICPDDAENDLDGDNFCESSDACPLDPDNDEDSDSICGQLDSCPLDAGNDADSDMVCGNRDVCPNDAADDADDDDICGDIDSCPADVENDPDSDNVCGPVDSCAYDANNDADGDAICGDVDSCSADGFNDGDSDDVCGDVDSCPADDENDADGDGVCAPADTCAYDAENDADGDNLCGDVDICPDDADNDYDSDMICNRASPTVTDPPNCDLGGLTPTGEPCAAAMYGSSFVASLAAMLVALVMTRA